MIRTITFALILLGIASAEASLLRGFISRGKDTNDSTRRKLSDSTEDGSGCDYKNDPAAILLQVFGVDPSPFNLGCQDSVRDDGACIPFEEAYAKFGPMAKNPNSGRGVNCQRNTECTTEGHVCLVGMNEFFCGNPRTYTAAPQLCDDNLNIALP